MERKIVNAVINSTMLGIEHGCFTFMVYVNFESCGQGFGGYSLDGGSKKSSKQCSFGMELLRQIIHVVGVNKWEELKGKNIRIDQEHEKIHGIGHIVKDKWVYPKKLGEKFWPKKEK